MGSFRVRTRPILMKGAMVVGMLPIALEWAIGLECLSAPAVLAIGGVVPLFYDPFEKLLVSLRGRVHAVDGVSRAERQAIEAN